MIILVLILLLIVPLFSSEYYYDDLRGFRFGLKILKKLSDKKQINSTEVKIAYEDYISKYKNQKFPLIYLSIPSLKNDQYKIENYNELRNDEFDIIEESSVNFKDSFISVIDLRHKTKISAFLNIVKTFYVCLILTGGAMLFSKDTNDLALRPIEKMIEKVNKIAQNPLQSNNEKIIIDNQYETSTIYNAIIKIGTLLALGFGEAGSEIIGINMAQGGDVNPLIPGVKQICVFGFCDIRNFTDATEVLQEEVMVFVNEIAKVVHRTVDKFSGAANKNIGDAFLLVWKTVSSKERIIESTELRKSKKDMSDISLISFLKIIAGINKKPQILKYSNDPRLNNRIPNYKVKMGFGLHIGWAIEGAIGSTFKIDASYLSPNVNMASRLEAATKQYGVLLLVSGDLYNCFSKRVKEKCREIDCVTVKGSINPIKLYTVDVDIDKVEKEKKNKRESIMDKFEKRIKHRLMKEAIADALSSKEIKANDFIDEDLDLNKIIIKKKNYKEFYELFENGINSYYSANWKISAESFEKCLEIMPKDGPSKSLYNYLKKHEFMAPKTWPGFRELTEK